MKQNHPPDTSQIQGRYPDRAKRMGPSDEFDGTVPHYGAEVDGKLAWAMFKAAAAGDIALIRELIAYDPALLNIQKWYEFPVYMAVRNGHADVVEEMLSAGADPGLSNYLYSSWQTLLKIARERKFTDVLQVLEGELTRRYNYHSDFHLLRDAIKHRDSQDVAQVLNRSPHLATSADEFGATALHWAALTRQTSLIDHLLDSGAIIDAVRAGGCTPIHLAVRGDYWFSKERMMGRAIQHGWAVAGYLLARGADYFLTIACGLGDRERVTAILTDDPLAANRLDSARTSPLRAAAGEGYTDIVRDLLDAGADPNQMEDLTICGGPLFAASAGNHLDTARLLLERGAQAHVGEDSSGTALSIVAHTHPEGCGPMQDLLRSFGADDEPWALSDEQISQKLDENPDSAKDPETIKHILRSDDETLIGRLLDSNPGAFQVLSGEAVTSLPKSPAAAKRIIDAGMDINRRDFNGSTMLWNHASKGNLEIVRLLADAGAEINVLDAMEGSSPLAAAAKNGHKEMVQLLLSLGAETELADGPWATPASLAECTEHEDLVDLLKDRKDSSK
jgi:ankyrin repeat protein